MASQIPYLDVQNLTKRFGAQVLFDNISFSIAEGQKVGLVARNGTGKSTLMSVLMDKEGHESGEAGPDIRHRSCFLHNRICPIFPQFCADSV